METYEKKDPIIVTYSDEIDFSCILFRCPYCGELFDTWDLLYQPKMNGTINYCPDCKREFTPIV